MKNIKDGVGRSTFYVSVNGTTIEKKSEKIYIDGRHIVSGRYKGILLTQVFIFGAISGASIFAMGLLILEWIINTSPPVQ